MTLPSYRPTLAEAFHHICRARELLVEDPSTCTARRKRDILVAANSLANGFPMFAMIELSGKVPASADDVLRAEGITLADLDFVIHRACEAQNLTVVH